MVTGQCTGLQIEKSPFEPWRRQCVVFLGKTLYSYSASKLIGTGKFNAGGTL